jgi:hypothetical protein
VESLGLSPGQGSRDPSGGGRMKASRPQKSQRTLSMPGVRPETGTSEQGQSRGMSTGGDMPAGMTRGVGKLLTVRGLAAFAGSSPEHRAGESRSAASGAVVREDPTAGEIQ